MSGNRDIRSYFSIGASKIKKDVKNSLEDDEFVPKVKKKCAAVIISDSDDDEPRPSPAKRQKSSESDNQKATTKNKNVKPSETKPVQKVNPSDVYGTAKVKRATVKSPSKTDHKNFKERIEKDQAVDNEKKQSERLKLVNGKTVKKREAILDKESKYFVKEESPKKVGSSTANENRSSPRNKSKAKENLKQFQACEKSSEVIPAVKQPVKNNAHAATATPEKLKGKKRKATETISSPAKKRSPPVETVAGKHKSKHSSIASTEPKTEHEDEANVQGSSSNATPRGHLKEDAKSNRGATREPTTPVAHAASPSVEKSKQNAYNYQRYLQREGPKHHGAKVLPKGKPNCLAKMVFVVTGVLDSLEREEAVSLIQQHGGKITSTVSRNTTYLVAGEEAGPSKLAKAESCKTPIIDEDGLLDLIREKSGIPKGQAEVSDASGKEEIEHDIVAAPTKNNSREASGFAESRSRAASADRDGREVSSPPSCSGSIGSTVSSVPSTESLLWVDKYRPASSKNVIGQQGDRSNLKKLQRWLSDWHANHSGHKKLVRPSPWAKDDNGAFFKAALLSGPPGVGKTTTAHLVCKELGFDVVEFNASDTRSKRLLHEEVQELLRNKSLFGYFKNGARARPTEKHVLLMDEVDGMAGNEDRGGVQELIQLIKNTRVPVICMCNDRHHPKIRSLVNHCFDLGFSKPRVEQIKGAMMSVCYKEGIKITPEALTDIITAANQDIRQVLHHLSVFSANSKTMSTEQTKKDANDARKILKLGPWDVVRKVFSAGEHKNMSLIDRMDLFFQDYNIGPLFVQENYLSVVPHAAKGNPVKTLECVAEAAESLTIGDVVEKTIRSNNSWSLLPVQAVFSSVGPGESMEGHLTGQIAFPAWLGKNSRAQKFSRLQQELQCHMRLRVTGDKQAVGRDYVQSLRQAVAGPLAERGVEGVDDAVRVLQAYSLTREDLDSILELAAWPGAPDPMAGVDSKVKAAFTRKYNKDVAMLPYAVDSVKKVAAKAAMLGEGEEIDPEEETEESQENDDVATDSMIKAKKRPAGKQKEAKDEKTNCSNGTKKARGKGRGR
ncbi:replication factor C subunit 1 [Bacillus rossius redtenbacheri]|uniref:replication factor C subunit 1 n=1 Tax=Bacillus rossius redtenbacheri TaxID=93214 RepID=UPI002FDCDE1A